MRHKVVYALYRVFAGARFSVLRFNYRGCGRTYGTFGDGEGEVGSAATCLDWLRAQTPGSSQCWVVGHCFGAWVAMQLIMRRPECTRFIAISPPTNIYDFSFLAPCPSPGLIVHGELDEIVPKESALRLAHHLALQRRRNKVDFRLVKGADHGFTHHIRELERIIFNDITAVQHPVTGEPEVALSEDRLLG